METSYGHPLRKALVEETELESALALVPGKVNIDDVKSLNIQLHRETHKEWSLEAEINSEKAKELTGGNSEGKEAEFKSRVSWGISMPLSSTTISESKAQKESSVNTSLPIADFVPLAQEEPKSREEEWLCHSHNLHSRVTLDSSRYAALFEEIERERVLWPEGVDENLGSWISRMDEQIRQSKELKLEMDALEEKYWEVDWLVKEKVCPTEIKLDGKREVESESGLSGEGLIPNTRISKFSIQSSTSGPSSPLQTTASAKNRPIICFRELILFDTFRSRAAFLVSRSHALDQEINLIEPQNRTVDKLMSWIALMDEIIKERDVLKEEIVLYGEKVGGCLKGLDVESSWRREYEEALSRRLDGLMGMLKFYGEEDLQRLEDEVEIQTRMKEVSDLPCASDPIDIALAETESSIIALLSTYRKAEISSLNSTLTAQPSPVLSDASSSKKPAFLAAAVETERALEDYVRAMKEEEELRAMKEIRGVLGSVTRDLYEKSSTAEENGAIAAGEDDQIPLAEEENTPTTPAGAKILNADEGEARDDGRLKYSTTARETPQHTALWPWAIPLVYVFLTLLVRGLFWTFAFLIGEAERESNPPRIGDVVHPCDMNWDSEFCPG